MKGLFLHSVFAALLLAGATAGASIHQDQAPPDHSLAEQGTLTVDWQPGLDAGFFTAKSDSAGARLLLGTYDHAQGLYAGYQATNGVRFLLRSGFQQNGRMHLRIRSSASSAVPSDATIGVSSDPRRPVTVQVGGVDLLTLLDPETSTTRASDKARRDLRRYLSSRQGEALVELIPALYVALEDLPGEHDGDMELLRRPLGVLRMLVDLASNQYAGFPNAQALQGARRAAAARDRCQGRCETRGRTFVVHSNGLFDIFSPEVRESKAISVADKLSSCAAANLPAGVRSKNEIDDYYNNLPEHERRRLNDECWGDCGPGCGWGFTTSSCRAHDFCVANHGHWACSHQAPQGDSLGTAIWSVTAFLLGFGDGYCTSDCGILRYATGGSNDPWSDPAEWYCESCYQPTNGGFCTFDVNCVDGPPFGG